MLIDSSLVLVQDCCYKVVYIAALLQASYSLIMNNRQRRVRCRDHNHSRCEVIGCDVIGCDRL